ncbi:hypothetical protein I4U23_004751 [Adineta vaga]|nr:hypothetical protein I4U23_004751 [Adineta vaga]
MAFAWFLNCFVISLMVNSISTTNPDRFEFNDCGSTGATIHKIDMTPMPLIYPDAINATLIATVKRPISFYTVSLKIERTISGIKLPIKCYLLDGNQVGACQYRSETVCDYINYWNFNGSESFIWLIPMMKLLGLLVNCPGNNIPEQTIIIDKRSFVLPTMSIYYTSYTNGLFNATVTVNELDAPSDQPFFCGTFKYTMRQRK